METPENTVCPQCSSKNVSLFPCTLIWTTLHYQYVNAKLYKVLAEVQYRKNSE